MTLSTVKEWVWKHRGMMSFMGALVVLLLGQGVYWSYSERQVSVLQRSDQTRARLGDLWLTVIDRTNLRSELQDCDPKQADAKVQHKLKDLRVELKMLRSDFTALETQLARIEGREPRKVLLDWVDPAVEPVDTATNLVLMVGDDTISPPLPPPPACPSF